jgi:hypothetical protein
MASKRDRDADDSVVVDAQPTKRLDTATVTNLAPFDHPFHDFGDEHTSPLTLRELAIMNWISEILSKPQWFDKINDDGIVDKWRAEIRASAHEFSAQFLSDANVIRYALDECKWLAKHREADGIDMPIERVFQCDSLIDDDLRTTFMAQVKLLQESIEPDWHPGSKQQVLDIVHPYVKNRRTNQPTNQPTTERLTEQCDTDHCILWCTALRVKSIANPTLNHATRTVAVAAHQSNHRRNTAVASAPRRISGCHRTSTSQQMVE